MIENLDKVLSHFDELSDIDVQEVLTNACLKVEKDAKEGCPVDDGTLRNSITSEVDGNVGTVGTNVEYAPYVHQGTGIYNPHGRKTPWVYQDDKGQWHRTVGQKPRPFLTDALDLNRDDIVAAFRKKLKETVK